MSRRGFLQVVRSKMQTETISGSGVKNDVPAPKNYRIEPYTGTLGQPEIMHLLRRSLFGVTQEDYVYFSKLSLSQCLDVLLSQPRQPAPPVNAYNDASYTDPDVRFGETWVDCLENESEANRRRLNNLYAWWVGLMLDPQRSLGAKMNLFWHNHMVAELQSTYDARTSYGYLAVIMKQSLGNVKQLISDMTICPGMLQYLSGNESTAEAPNENYSREMQELFTVGKGPDSHYTQDDINAAARVLTGWTTTPNGMKTIYNAAVHDSGDKHFSAFYNNTVIKGRSGKESADETRELIDMIFANREVARHTCRSLYRWFVHSSIDSSVETSIIHPMAEILIENNFEMVPALRALLGSQHFFDASFIGSQIKNPVDYTIGFCRQFYTPGMGSDLHRHYIALENLVQILSMQGMCPGEPPNVAGWPAYYLSPGYDKLWINSDSVVQRESAVDRFLSDQADADLLLRFDVLRFASQLSDPGNSDQIITDSTSLLSAIPFGAAHRKALKNMLESGSDRSWRDLWADHQDAPDDPKAKNAVIKRLNAFYNYTIKRAECHLM